MALSLGKYTVQEWIILVFFSFAVATILNVLINMAFPAIPIVKTGFALVLLLVSIVLVMLFTVAKDGKLDKEDIISVVIVLAIMVVVFLVTKKFVPGIFSIAPDSLKETFSFLGA